MQRGRAGLAADTLPGLLSSVPTWSLGRPRRQRHLSPTLVTETGPELVCAGVWGLTVCSGTPPPGVRGSLGPPSGPGLSRAEPVAPFPAESQPEGWALSPGRHPQGRPRGLPGPRRPASPAAPLQAAAADGEGPRRDLGAGPGGRSRAAARHCHTRAGGCGCASGWGQRGGLVGDRRELGFVLGEQRGWGPPARPPETPSPQSRLRCPAPSFAAWPS